jgi:hypothetical protein
MSKTKSDEQVGVVFDPEEKPKVGSAEYDWSAHYDTKDLYTHTFPDGTVVAIRRFSTVLSDTFLYKIRKLRTDLDFRLATIDEAACETAQVVLESLTAEPGTDPLKDMFNAWSSDGTSRGEGDEGLTPGK